MNKYTIKHFQADFPDDNACLTYIFRRKYGSDPVCPKCGKTGFYRVAKRKCFACAWCSHQLHPTAGSIFHKSPTKLTLWFYALYLASQSKNGVSAKELERHLGVTYKCAWRIAYKIRELMKQPTTQLEGTVEMDEMYVGGRKKGITGRGAVGKMPVVGVVQRGGEARAEVTVDTAVYTIKPLMRKHVKFGSELMTDTYSSYYNAKKWGYTHKQINHKKEQYVKGKIHTNTIEGFWSQVKRSIDGTYHAVSPKYLQFYLDEFVYRYNHRNSAQLFDSLLGRVCRLPYSKA
ncbi:MAG TPA: IS1595 family transposase [Patescibacteria group bacterium]